MTYVLQSASRYDGKPLYFARMTGIGPMTTADLAEARTWERAADALRSPACLHPLVRFSAVRLEDLTGEAPPRVGEKWRHRRERHRVVTVTGVDGDRVRVTRNTSRRTQPIGLATLRRDYRLMALEGPALDDLREARR